MRVELFLMAGPFHFLNSCSTSGCIGLIVRESSAQINYVSQQ